MNIKIFLVHRVLVFININLKGQIYCRLFFNNYRCIYNYILYEYTFSSNNNWFIYTWYLFHYLFGLETQVIKFISS